MKNKPAKKKKPGEKLNNTSSEYGSVRKQTALLENMHKDIKIIVEQHSSMIEKLDEHSESLAVIKSELDTVKVATMENSHRIKPLEVSQQKLEAGQQRIEQKLDAVTIDHERRITKLEERVLP